MFARCPPRVRVVADRLDIRTVVKSLQISHLPRLIILLELLIQTSRYAGVCMNIVNITVDIVSRSSSTESNESSLITIRLVARPLLWLSCTLVYM